MSNNTQTKDIQKLTTEVKALSKAIRKLTNTITIATDAPTPVYMTEGMEITVAPGQTPKISMTAQAAVATLRDICTDAEDCSRDGCPIHDWCDQYLPNQSIAPKYWTVPGIEEG